MLWSQKQEKNDHLIKWLISKVGKISVSWTLKAGGLSGLTKFLTTEIPLTMMKNAFYFTLEALFVFNIFKLLSWIFGHAKK